MGMEHERLAICIKLGEGCAIFVNRIHLETSSVLIRQLPADSVQKPGNWIYAPMQSGTLP